MEEDKRAGGERPPRWYAAPMEGVTGWVWRGLHSRYFPGTDRYYIPFFSPTGNHLFTPRARRELCPEHNEGVPAVPQLLTRSAEDFLWAARELHAMGYGEVNLNLGCPSGTVVAKGKGAGLLARPEELERFLDAVFAAAPCAVSIKTRLGMTDEAEFTRLLAIYNRYPVAELIIHPRVQREGYQGQVRFGAFEAAARESRSAVCYNGDLKNRADCAALAARQPGLPAAMIGRGLIADPALIRKVRGGKEAGKAELEAFLTGLYEGYIRDFGNVSGAVARMKEVWSYQIRLFPGSEKHAKLLRKAGSAAEYESAAASIFRDLPLADDVVCKKW